MTQSSRVIAITTGDPCGIGPEVILAALARAPQHPVVVIGDVAVFEQTARRLGRRLPRWRVLPAGQSLPARSSLTFLDCGHRSRFMPGHSSAQAGRASLDYLNAALALWRQKRIRALVTGPVTKWAVSRHHPGFVGQTEYLAEALGVRQVVMLFVSDRLRVAVLTRHLPLNRVASSVTRPLLSMSLQLTAQALRRQFHIRRPALAVCGVNPHAGEGKPGSEESRVMEPVLRALRRVGLRCDGPFAADGFFASRALERYDAVICPYHDQGLIPFKMLARDRGCQMSVGLPLIRTSPDHGSALDIAGRGLADAGSMRYALRLAARLAGC